MAFAAHRLLTRPALYRDLLRHANTSAAESFMAELQASGLTPTEIKRVCTKHPDMLSKHWTPAARKQKIALLKKIEEQERMKAKQQPTSSSSK